MAKKQDAFYFETFVKCMEHGCRAAEILDSSLRNFHPEKLESQLAEIHVEEHEADVLKHELLNVLARAFITPIEREDIIELSQNLDEVVDKIDDVLMRMYCNNMLSVRPDALEMTAVLTRCCSEVKALMVEFADFKRSKHIQEHIIAVNTLEEEADRLFRDCLRKLHTESTDPIEIMTWHEVYTYLEKCVDACEHVADVVETVIMKNT